MGPNKTVANSEKLPNFMEFQFNKCKCKKVITGYTFNILYKNHENY